MGAMEPYLSETKIIPKGYLYLFALSVSQK